MNTNWICFFFFSLTRSGAPRDLRSIFARPVQIDRRDNDWQQLIAIANERETRRKDGIQLYSREARDASLVGASAVRNTFERDASFGSLRHTASGDELEVQRRFAHGIARRR